MNIIFPELNNPIINSALALYNSLPDVAPITPIPTTNLQSACDALSSNAAAALVAGIDYSSRDVILACRDHLGMATYSPFNKPDTTLTYKTFSGLAVMERQTPSGNTETFLLADMAACKHPTKTQLLEIIHQTIISSQKILSDTPRLALLSFSTLGSGGRDEIITTFNEIVAELRSSGRSDFLIDGELQLDAAINPTVAKKKAPHSPVAGRANVLIAPDLNSGNLLYKSFEQLAGFTVAGPILQGFNYPVSDLSRGSTINDVVLTLKTLVKLAS